MAGLLELGKHIPTKSNNKSVRIHMSPNLDGKFRTVEISPIEELYLYELQLVIMLHEICLGDLFPTH